MKVTDGQTKQTVVHQQHEDRLYVATESDPDYLKAVAEANKRLRIEQPHKSVVRLHLQLTPKQYDTILKWHPEVGSGTMDSRRRAWEKVAKLYPHIVGKPMENRNHGGQTM